MNNTLEKNCFNCKWYIKGKCTNENNLVPTFSLENSVHYYVEQGELNDAIREKFDINEITKLYTDALLEAEFLKKTMVKKLDTFNDTEIEDRLVEMIDELIFDTVLETVKNIHINNGFQIKDPREFFCSCWE